MTIVNLFVRFINEILSIKIMGFDLLSCLLATSGAIVIFKIIYILTNTDKKENKNKKGKGD